MRLDKRLFEILQCPFCTGKLIGSGDVLVCGHCDHQYGLQNGIPNLAIFESAADSDAFNKTQALYEKELHDEEARHDYEASVVKVFGTKTRLMAKQWARTISSISSRSSGDIKVLDYGCGTGQLSRVLSRAISPLFAFDISPVSVQRNVSENHVLACTANAFFLPFKDKTFDAVCINGVLHHIVDLDRAVAEIARITRGGAYLLRKGFLDLLRA